MKPKSNIINQINNLLLFHSNIVFLFFCLFVHIFYFILFLCLDCPPLAIINAFSASFYVLFLFLYKKKEFATMIITYIEIYCYSITATFFLGFESDFYLYIVGMMFSAIMIFSKSIKGRLFSYITGMISLFATITVDHLGFFPKINDPNVIEHFGLGFRIINSFICCLTIMYLSVTYLAQTKYNNEKLTYIANHDELTGLYSRTYFTEITKNDFNELANSSIIMLDIDNFKMFNDQYGHAVGDEALKKLSDCIKKSVRSSDIVIRWGGEEFIVCLINCSLENAKEIAEAIRVDISSTPFYHFEDTDLKMTVTLGVSQVKGTAIEAAINKADKLLYKGKESGKNQVVSD